MSKLYAITNQKGGVGKTTTCARLGTAFTELGLKNDLSGRIIFV